MSNQNLKKLTIIHLQGTRFGKYTYVDKTEKDFGRDFKSYQTYLCEEQAKFGHKLIGILFSKDGKSTIIEKRKNYLLYFYPGGIQTPSILKDKYKEPLNLGIFSNIIKMKPDIINFHGLFTYFLLYLFLIPMFRLKKIKTISFIRGQDPIFSFMKTQRRVSSIQKFLSIFVFIIQFLLCKFSDLIICQNKRVGYLLQKYKLSKKKKIYLVPNGIDFNLFTSIKREFCIKNLNLDPKFRYILMVNRIYFVQKDILTVLESLKDFLAKNQQIKIIIIGDGPDLPKLKSYIKNNKLTEKIIHIGFVSYNKMPLYYNVVDCFILHSKFEGMPKVILEAFACKTPVIASDIEANKYLVKHKKNGLLVEFQNKNQILNAIKVILSDNDLRNKLITNAYNSIQKLSWKNISYHLIKLYKKQLKNKRD
ncbi:MAG: glycosyltransferase family 4 protein [Candidatus Helarchaeota archaeon]